MNVKSSVEFPGPTRLHVGIAVSNIKESASFYKRLFGVDPSKVRNDYAKFEPIDPSVNLSLIEVAKVQPGNREHHFGIQVKSAEQLEAMRQRLTNAGMSLEIEKETTCCYAVQDKLWVSDPDGNRWEVFLVLQSNAELRNASKDCCTEDCCTDALN